MRGFLAGSGFASIAILALFAARSGSIPNDSPLARMYRTEADLSLLAGAVEQYREHHGAYPPPGSEGLSRAAEFLSGSLNFLPGGPPPDGWGRAFHYVGHEAYGVEASPALTAGGAPFAAGGFQLYSLGADGKAGLEDPADRRDNICSWETSKPWRKTYKELQKAYGRPP